MKGPVIVEGRINGIDVSSVNRITNPKAIKDAGFEYAYIQSSRYSRTPELSFARTLGQLRDAGLSCGAYHFCSHDTDPRKQAEFFYKASGGLGSKPGELPPMVDWEYCTPSKYADAELYPEGHPQHCVDWLATFLAHVMELWYPDNANRLLQRFPVVYTYPTYSGAHQPALAAKKELNGYPLAYASYKLGPWLPKEGQGPLHHLPLPFSHWTLWQYSGDLGLPVPGIAGACDRQVFNGTGAEWDNFRGVRRDVSASSYQVKVDEVLRK